MTQFVSDCLRIMRLAIGRRNENDPDSTDDVLVSYLNDFINLTMTDDVKLFEQYGTLKFTIDDTNTTGVYTFNDVGATDMFSNISMEAYITLQTPPDASISWNKLYIYQDPNQFYGYWGIENTSILIPGYPTEMLYYGNEFVFRTIPNTAYDIHIFGYKIIPAFAVDPVTEHLVGDPELPFDHYLRYFAYGAAMNYARDFRFDKESKAMLAQDFAHERKLLLTRTHNQIKCSRGKPRF